MLSVTRLANVQPAGDTAEPVRQNRTWLGWVPSVLLPAVACAFRGRLAPWQFMWLLSLAIFWGCKFETWFRARAGGARGNLARNLGYLFLWPGMDASTFLASSVPATKPRARDWLGAASKTFAGAVCIWLFAGRVLGAHPLLGGWVGMLGMILILHFGTFHLLAFAWQAVGVNAQPIMRSPISAQSLGEFWGKRWNLGFRQLTHGLVFDPLRRRFGLAAATLSAFFVSGLIHDFVISFPARGGYGLPTAYFLVQGIAVLIEKSALGRRLGIQQGVRGWLFTLICTGGPAFLLFHPPFVTRVIVPFLAAIGAAR